MPITVQPSPPSSPEPSSSCQTKTLSPSDDSSPPPPAPVSTPLLSACGFDSSKDLTHVQSHSSGLCVWLSSLSTMSSRSIHGAAGVRTSFLFKAESYSIARIDHTVFVHHLLVDTWSASMWGCCDYCCYERGCTNSLFKKHLNFLIPEVPTLQKVPLQTRSRKSLLLVLAWKTANSTLGSASLLLS